MHGTKYHFSLGNHGYIPHAGQCMLDITRVLWCSFQFPSTLWCILECQLRTTSAPMTLMDTNPSNIRVG